MTDLRIKRTWTDPEGRVWYVVRGPLAGSGYPSDVGPSKAFQEALREASARRRTPHVAQTEPAPEIRAELGRGAEGVREPGREATKSGPLPPQGGADPLTPRSPAAATERVDALLYRTRTLGGVQAVASAPEHTPPALSHPGAPTYG